METSNMLRLFGEKRLSPWIPEHDRYIRSRIAALEVEDPSSAKDYALKYAMITAEYYKKHPELSIAPLPDELQAKLSETMIVSVKAEPKIDTLPKKRGRKAKTS